MSDSGAGILKQVGGAQIELPSLPASVTRIIQGLDDENADYSEIAELISEDISIAGRVLALANSALYNPTATPFASLAEALSRLGFIEARNVVLASAVVDQFSNVACPFDYRAFWKHCLTSAIAAGALADRSRLVPSSTRRGDNPYFIAGLLHQIGVLLLVQRQGEAYARVLEKAAVSQESLTSIERDVFGFTHGEVSGALIREWGLPEGVAVAAEFHEAPCEAPAELRTWAEVIHLATWIAGHEGIGHAVDRRNGGFAEGTWFNLGIGVEEIPDVIADFTRASERSEMMLALMKT